MTRPTVVIFAKVPRVGRVKTRLAREIGAVAAAMIYRRLMLDVIRKVGRSGRWRTIVAVTPDQARHHGFSGADCEGQGPGDLGRRMLRAVNRHGKGPVIIVGSDIPELGTAQVAAAFTALRSHDVVFGPALDGGYWLMGFRHRRLAPHNFHNVRWSGPHALADSRAALRPGLRVAILEPLRDLDDLEDLRALGITAL